MNTVEAFPHHVPEDLSDRLALAVTRLETVAAVPGMVGATITHLRSLRRMVDDDGWIRTLLVEAVISYTAYLEQIDAGRAVNVAAPEVARKYWNLPADATLRDVVLVIRADEAHHRGVNHSFASELAGKPVDPRMLAPSPWHTNVTDRRA